MFKVCCLASVFVAAGAVTQVAAQQASLAPLAATAATAEAAVAPVAPEEPVAVTDMTPPNVRRLHADWNAVRGALPAYATPAGAADLPDEPTDPLLRLNDAAKTIFPTIGTSAVPVLLPVDAAALLRDKTAGMPPDRSKYLAGFDASNFFFFAGPAGYDAAFKLKPQGIPELDFAAGKRVDVLISGSALVYELDRFSPAQGSPVPELESKFPGIRRLFFEQHLHYTFVRFGVPYFVTVMCHDGRHRRRRLSCGEADKVGRYFLKALNVTGGAPQRLEPAPAAAGDAAAPGTLERPAEVSADFTYYPPGDLLPGTGMNGTGGRPDTTAYARIRFPLAKAPSYVNSQAFMNWGDCDFTGRIALGGRGRDAAYRCKVNSIRLVNDELKNYAYPWRDNFCEHRYFEVSQCPSGLGHQGEDIRPTSCLQRDTDSERCQPYQDNVVAVHDGAVLRTAGDEALYLVVNAPGEHLRFRYLHMNPQLLDAAGMVSGRMLKQGDVIGAVDDYQSYQGGTSYHLHFDLQVPTSEGFVFVNPYMTLVSAYERLIGARGRIVEGATFASANPDGAIAAAKEQRVSAPQVTGAIVHTRAHPAVRLKGRRSNREHRANRGRHCPTRLVEGHRRRDCRIGAAASGSHARRAVRSLDRSVSRQGNRTRHHDGDLRSNHARAASRHGGAR